MYNMLKILTPKNINNNYIIFHHGRKFSNMAPEEKSEEITDYKLERPPINCNKSGLLKQHRNMLHNRVPYQEPNSWIHLTEKYQRKIFARYGSESGINPRICFETKSDKLAKLRYERLVEPETLHAMIDKFKAEEKCKNDEIIKREEEISKKLEKLNQWKQDLNAKILKKEAEAIAAKEKKERLIEEVRRHFGYKIDPRDERFKEVLEQKEKQDKKKKKEEKRKAKEQQMMAKLLEKSAKIETPVEQESQVK